MPTYEYRCTKCECEFEHFQKMSDAHLTKCLECGGKLERKVSSGAGLLFKGSGFYETDYKTKTPTDKAEKKAEKKAESGGGGKSDKPAKKSPTEKKSKSKSKAKPGSSGSSE